MSITITITAEELVKEIKEELNINAIEICPNEFVRLSFVPLTESSTMVTKVKFTNVIRQLNIIQIAVIPFAVDSKMDIITKNT